MAAETCELDFLDRHWLLSVNYKDKNNHYNDSFDSFYPETPQILG
ncbi:MAG: hypothetical protein M2R45_04498 [Verrucomicrobia subdivision 3 bacterium]|nr:hypothetical protein [Limisphaerales bacterium]MCS1412658.1 hypothetical protein [Limisphaerales bacterium]